MLRILVDQDFDHDILRGFIRRVPQLDSITAYEVGMSEASDPELLVLHLKKIESFSLTIKRQCQITLPIE